MTRQKETTREATITEARKHLLELPDELSGAGEPMVLTKRGKPVLALMPWELYDSIMETLEIMADDDLLEALKESIRNAGKGRTYSTAQLRRELGL